jgi:uncharacterized protein YjiS (DUF1127 family)
MLYVDKIPGNVSLRVRLLARLSATFRRPRRMADLDLLAMSPHLRRDLGLSDGPVHGEKDVRLWM